MLANNILTELQQLLAELGDGGQVGPSVYDTAQVLRNAAPHTDLEDAYGWLLAQQQPDGGWGEPGHPLYRDVPTAAAVLALHARDGGSRHRSAIAAGVAFLKRNQGLWQAPLSNDLPVGIELILPKLLADANAVGLELPTAQYEALIQFGKKRLERLRERQFPAGSPPLHSWEAWGETPSAAMVDGAGSVGHSPAATAAWLRSARTANIDESLLRKAEDYLASAASGTGVGIAGVVPDFWPFPVFESSWMLHTLALGELLQSPTFQCEIERILLLLRGSMTQNGVGMSIHFAQDGDDTAMVMTMLSLAGQPLSDNPLRRFSLENQFLTYPGELQPALTTTIHAIHALRLAGESTEAAEAYLEACRDADGLWSRDKWHSSWLYTTSHAIAALGHGRPGWRDERALVALLARQHPCGGWGGGATPSFEETAYAVLALNILAERRNPAPAVADAMSKAFHWMLSIYVPFSRPTRAMWVDKELYCPIRVARTYELVGLWVAASWVL